MVTLKNGTIGVRSFHRAFTGRCRGLRRSFRSSYDTLYMVFEAAKSLGTGETIGVHGAIFSPRALRLKRE